MGHKPKVAIRFLIMGGGFFALLFISAGSLKFWQGWAYLMVWFVPGIVGVAYFSKHNPELIERRLRTRETVPEQKTIMKFIYAIYFVAYLLPGLDHRFGWSHPALWVIVLAQALVFGSWATAFWVMSVNRFAGRTIQVDPEQRVISTGPYRIVRHPMYLGICVMLLFTPLALGSYFAVPAFALIIPLIVLRLLNEEKVLRQELPGYSDYCLHTHFRMVPLVW